MATVKLGVKTRTPMLFCWTAEVVVVETKHAVVVHLEYSVGRGLCKLRDSLKCRDMVDTDRSTPDGDNMYSDNLPEVIQNLFSDL